MHFHWLPAIPLANQRNGDGEERRWENTTVVSRSFITGKQMHAPKLFPANVVIRISNGTISHTILLSLADTMFGCHGMALQLLCRSFCAACCCSLQLCRYLLRNPALLGALAVEILQSIVIMPVWQAFHSYRQMYRGVRRYCKKI